MNRDALRKKRMRRARGFERFERRIVLAATYSWLFGDLTVHGMDDENNKDAIYLVLQRGV